jgi:enoyl-CoA hydratase
VTNRFEVRKEGAVAWVISKRADALNAMRNADWVTFNNTLRGLEADESLRVVVIRGEGQAFCAGADVKEMVDDLPTLRQFSMDYVEARRIQGALQESTRIIRSSRMPYIAAVHGVAVGAGFELCMACDLVVAEEGTRMGFPEVNVAVTITNGGTFLAARILGLAKARELAYTGELIEAEEAWRLGAVARLAKRGTVIAEAEKLAARIASRAPVAVTLHKRMLDEGLEGTLNTSLNRETDALLECATSADHAEGCRAFVEKRTPKFTGR